MKVFALATLVLCGVTLWVVKDDPWPWAKADRNGLVAICDPSIGQDVICRNIRMKLMETGDK